MKRLKEVEADMSLFKKMNTIQHHPVLYQNEFANTTGQNSPSGDFQPHQMMGANPKLDIDYMLQTGNPNGGADGFNDSQYHSTMTQGANMKSLRNIIEESKSENAKKPQRFGLHQLRDNIQDPVRLAVKEVLKAQRELKLNVVSPGPGHY